MCGTAEIANALTPVAIVQETEAQQTEQELNLAVYAQASLQAQIDKAVAGQVTTLTLQGETSEDLTIPAGKSIVLDLNGHTLTNQSGHTRMTSPPAQAQTDSARTLSAPERRS